MILPDRIDFTTLADGRVIILKLRRDTTDPQAPRDIPLPDDGHDIKPATFNLDAALDWCRDHGYTIRQIPGSARAWLGKPWPIRTRHRIKLTRKRAERDKQDYSTDFAFDG